SGSRRAKARPTSWLKASVTFSFSSAMPASPDFDDAVLALGLQGVAGHAGRHLELFLVAALAALGAQRETRSLDADVDVLGLHAGHLGGDHQLVAFVEDVDQGLALGLDERLALVA